MGIIILIIFYFSVRKYSFYMAIGRSRSTTKKCEKAMKDVPQSIGNTFGFTYPKGFFHFLSGASTAMAR